MKKTILIYFLIIIILLTGACSVSKKPKNDNKNLSFLYNPSFTKLHPEYKIYHDKDESSVLLIHIYPEELLFNYANEKNRHQARFKIHYRLFAVSNKKLLNTIIDSATYQYKIDMDNTQNDFMSSIRIKAQENNKYLLKIFATDENRKSMNQDFIIIDKSSVFTYQNYNVISAKTGIPLFRDIISSSEKVQILNSRSKTDTIYIKYFINKYKIPLPPFSVTTQESVLSYPDTIFSMFHGDTTALHFKDEGIYLIQSIKSGNEGVTLFRFSENFPKIKTTSDMLRPIAYLTSSAEYNQIIKERNKKLSIDNFWIGLADNMNSAKELIRVFYTRVNYANIFFTSDKEGWKTDRGMIYIIYGPPQKIYKALNNEKWVYLTSTKNSKVEYNFSKRENCFDNNDFILHRKDEYGSYWNKAINSWRKGKIFSFDNY